MDVTLERVARTVVARGPDGGPVGPPVRGRLEDLLTYYERAYDYAAAADGQGGFSLVTRRLYGVDTRTGLLYFPLGLRPRVTNALLADGHRVAHAGGRILDLDRVAQSADLDGLLADFQVYPGQDTCLARIAGSDGGIIAANTGWGKAQPLDATVYTPTGPRRMGDVRVGDVVCHPHAGTSTVVAVHPRGVVPVYRVEFEDGAVVRCCGDHLWRVRRRAADAPYEVVSTHTLLARTAAGGVDARVTAARAIRYDPRPTPVPPFVLGALVGDGLPIPAVAGYAAVTARYRAELTTLGLWGLGPADVFVPEAYLRNSAAVREEVVGGLLTAHGRGAANPAAGFVTSSARLAADVVELVRSLGGLAAAGPGPAAGTWAVTLTPAAPGAPPPDRLVGAVVPDGAAEARCITVSAADGLYVTDGCVPTHNSVLLRMLCRLYSRAKIHVVTKSATLAREIHDDLQQVIPNPGFVGGGKRVIRRVTVFIADSLHHGMGDADIVLADEVHELAAPKYAEKLGMYSRARMFGLSATPTGRADNRDLVAEALFGPILYTISYQDAQAQGRVVPITVEWLRVATGPDLGGLRRPDIRERVGVWRNDVRNGIIARRAARFGPDEQVLIMVKTIDHAVRLKALLPDYSLAYAKDGMDEARIRDYVRQGLLPADEPVMTGARVEHLRQQFAAGTLKKVIANYVWSTGVNFRTLAVLIRADAAASEIRDGQIPGRVCRRVAGVKEAALMIDCWDAFDPSLLGRARKRKANYAKRGWVQLFEPQAAGPTLPGTTP